MTQQHQNTARPRVERARRRWAFVGVGVLAAVLALVDVTITGPRVHVRWVEGIGDAARTERESRFGLSDARPVPGAALTWRYSLDDASGDNIRALLEDSAVDDTAYLDPDRLTPLDGRTVRVAVWYPFNDLFTHPRQLLQLHRSVWLLLAGGIVLWAAGTASGQRRRSIVVGALTFVGILGVVLPFDPSDVTMGGSADHVRSRNDFEAWFGGRVRYEKHLSQVVLLQDNQRLEVNQAAPERALVVLARGATLWFVLSALAIGWVAGADRRVLHGARPHVPATSEQGPQAVDRGQEIAAGIAFHHRQQQVAARVPGQPAVLEHG
jgi:hypothetical protein